MAIRKPKRILTNVRPARVACLIYQDDEDWQASCLRIIEFFSSVWGGAYNIIVPTDGKDLAKDFWKILYAYDADYIYYYRKTAKDLKTTSPEQYKAWLDAQLQSYLGGDQLSNIDFVRRRIEETAERDCLTPKPTGEFQLEIRQRLAPFHHVGNIIKGIISNSRPNFPLTPIPIVLAGCEEKTEVAVFTPSHLGFYPLWLASVTGLMNEGLKLDLEQMGSVGHSLPTGEYSIDLVTSERERNALTSARNLTTPFQLTNMKLGIYRSVKGSLLRGPLIVVAGETLFDFCLYYSLARLREPVLWLPQAWLRSERTDGGTGLFHLFAQSLRSLIDGVDMDPRCVFTSQSLAKKQLDELVDDLDSASLFRTEGLEANTEVSFD